MRNMIKKKSMDSETNESSTQIKDKEIKLIQSEKSKLRYGVNLKDRLGSGGYGVVYRAYSLNSMDERLVCKVISLKNLEAKAEAQKEISILKRLPRHQNIVKTIPLDCHSENNYYIFMELCPGGALDKYLRDKKYDLSEEQILDLFYQLVQGYNQLYQQNIIHHDIKPANILIGQDQCYKLADFGLSVLSDQTKTKITAGTRTYMAPEKVISGWNVDYKADLYSLGVLLYIIITKGSHPYIKNLQADNQHFFAQLKTARQKMLPPWFLSSYSLTFQNFFFTVIQPMIQKRPNNRPDFEAIYQTVQTHSIFTKSRVPGHSATQLQVSNYNFIVTQRTQIVRLKWLQSLADSQVEEEYTKSSVNGLIFQSQVELPLQVATLNKISNFISQYKSVVVNIDFLARVVRSSRETQIQIQSLENQLLISLLLLSLRMINDLVEEMNRPTIFQVKEWALFRKEDGGQFQQILIGDKVDIEHILQNLQNHKLKIKNYKEMERFYAHGSINQIFSQINTLLKSELQSLIKEIKVTDRVRLEKIKGILRILDVGKEPENWLRHNTKSLEESQSMLEYEAHDVLFNRIVEKAMREYGMAPKIIDINMDDF